LLRCAPSGALRKSRRRYAHIRLYTRCVAALRRATRRCRYYAACHSAARVTRALMPRRGCCCSVICRAFECCAKRVDSAQAQRVRARGLRAHAAHDRGMPWLFSRCARAPATRPMRAPEICCRYAKRYAHFTMLRRALIAAYRRLPHYHFLYFRHAVPATFFFFLSPTPPRLRRAERQRTASFYPPSLFARYGGRPPCRICMPGAYAVLRLRHVA